MAKQRLFPEPEKQPDETAGPRQNFENIATKIFTVTKSQIDEREKQWRERKAPKRR
jgi:hypothetical protein